MSLLTENLNRLWSSFLINEFSKKEINNFYLSPGLRNAPLIAALEYHSKAKIFLGIDERAQAFRAIGSAKASGSPAVLICTSGTAAANYFPAVIEAERSNTPLIILSADRPYELIEVGSNQTMNQENLFGVHALESFSFHEPSEKITPSFIQNVLSRLISKAVNERGPIHINLPFREPLDNSTEAISSEYLNDFNKQANAPSLSQLSAKIEVSLKDSIILNQLRSSKKAFLVIGELGAQTDSSEIKKLFSKFKGNKFADISSSLKFSASINDGQIPTLDHPEILKEFDKNPPDLILHLGGKLTSKRFYEYLSNKKNDITYIQVNDLRQNRAQSNSSMKLKLSPEVFSKGLNKQELPSYSKFLKDCYPFVQKKEIIIDDGPLTYPYITKKTIESLPTNSHLYIGNSTIIRSFDSFASLDSRKDFNILSHRGVSGIEGFIAATCGFGETLNTSSDASLSLFIGDISFLHDLNSLALLKNVNHPISIYLINNSGGGIFSLLPIAKEKPVLQHISSPHEYNFHDIAKQFDISYVKIEKPNEFDKVISQKPNKHQIIELIVNNDQNIKLYEKLRTVTL